MLRGGVVTRSPSETFNKTAACRSLRGCSGRLGQITRTIGTIRDTYPDQSLTLHLHDTRGMAVANAYAGLMMGVADFDTSIGGIGGCPFAAHKGAAGNP